MPGDRAAISDLAILTTSFVLIFMGAGAQQQFLVPYFHESQPWSPLERSLVPAVVYIAMAISRVPTVWIVSVVGERAAMIAGAACYVAFPAVVWFTGAFWALIAGAAIWGVGASMLWLTSSIRVLDVARESQYGAASGIFTSGAHAGFFLGVLVLSVVAANALRDVFFVAAIVTGIGWLLLACLPASNVAREPPRMKAVFSVAGSADGRIVMILLTMQAIGFGLMLVPLSEDISEALGIGGLALAAGYPAARVVVSLAGGWLSDRLGRRAMIAGAFLVAGAGLACTAVKPTSAVALGIGIFALGLLGGLVPTLAMAYVGDVAHPSTRLMVHATLFTGRDLGVAGAMLVGQVLQVSLGDFGATFGVFALVFVACGVWSIGLSTRPIPVRDG